VPRPTLGRPNNLSKYLTYAYTATIQPTSKHVLTSRTTV